VGLHAIDVVVADLVKVEACHAIGVLVVQRSTRRADLLQAASVRRYFALNATMQMAVKNQPTLQWKELGDQRRRVAGLCRGRARAIRP